MTEQSNTFIILSNGELRQVPDGADPDTFRKVQEAGLDLAANPKRRRKSSTRSRKSGKRNHHASSVLTSTFEQETQRNRATAELVKRVNNDRESEEEPGSPRFLTLNGMTILEVF